MLGGIERGMFSRNTHKPQVAFLAGRPCQPLICLAGGAGPLRTAHALQDVAVCTRVAHGAVHAPCGAQQRLSVGAVKESMPLRPLSPRPSCQGSLNHCSLLRTWAPAPALECGCLAYCLRTLHVPPSSLMPPTATSARDLTLNPKPYTLNPKPSTLNPKP